jgi:hypothetical protein
MSVHDFLREWPESRRDQFSRAALEAIFGYLEELADDCGGQIEFDPIGICCDWTEFDDLAEFNEQYGTELESWAEVAESTQVVELSGDGAVIVDY